MSKKESQARWRKNHGKEYYAKNKHRWKKSANKTPAQHRDQKYGKGAHDYLQEQIELQDNCCAICDEELTNANLDHDHETGMWRSALCQRCNNGIGCFDDNPKLIAKALAYLQYWNNRR